MRYTILTVINYPRNFFLPGLLSMALFRLPMLWQKRHDFIKLMGTGRNGSFDIHPDWQQWTIFSVTDQSPEFFADQDPIIMMGKMYGDFIARWCRWWKCECCFIICEIREGHGTWNGRTFADRQSKIEETEGLMAVLTRATIRFSKLKAFWKNVSPVNAKMKGTPGLLYSIGVGEVPFTRQATFSVWESKKHMQTFAYSMHDHREVIAKTRKEKWYSEEMFLRLKPVFIKGTVKGFQPFSVLPVN
jgi:hypothetical protein